MRHYRFSTMTRRASLASALAALLPALAPAAHAQTAWPNRPIKLIVAGTAGSPIDIPGRLVAEKLKDRLGQPVFIENQPQAGGTIAAAAVAKAAPDGYTFLLGFNGPLAYAPFLYSRLPYDPLKDFAPVIKLSGQPYLLGVNAALGINTMPELLARLKSQPGTLNYSSLGNGTGTHIAGELFKKRTETSITHVPYPGGAGAPTAVAAGDVQMMFAPVGMLTQLAQTGKVKLIAVSSRQRFALLPGVPTALELGIADFEAEGWVGIVAPAGTPKDVIGRLNSEINAILQDADIRNKLAGAFVQAAGGAAEDFAVTIRTEMDKWGPIIRETGAKLD